MRFVAFLVVCVSLSGSAEMTITVNEQVSRELNPDILRGYLGYQAESKSSEPLKRDLNAIVAEAKRMDPKGEKCRGGGYQLAPRYIYKEQKQEFAGYFGSLSLECEFDDVEPYNRFTAALDRVSTGAVKKTQGALTRAVSDKQRNAVQEELKGELIVKAYGEARRFSRITGNECRVASIAFGGVTAPSPVLYERKTMAMASAPTESPLPSAETVALEAAVVYVCEPEIR